MLFHEFSFIFNRLVHVAGHCQTSGELIGQNRDEWEKKGKISKQSFPIITKLTTEKQNIEIRKEYKRTDYTFDD